MVLVDTSVWIRFLANRPPYAAELDRLLERDEAAEHEGVQHDIFCAAFDPAKGEALSRWETTERYVGYFLDTG